MISKFSTSAVNAVQANELAFCHFIKPNDVGATGSHQAGYYVSKAAAPVLFDELGTRGENLEKFVKIKWQNDFETTSRFIYYGKGTRNEYRITRFGKNFPFLQPENIGDLLIFVKQTSEDFLAYVLSTEDDINYFLETFNIPVTGTGQIIEKGEALGEANGLETMLYEYANTIDSFPTTAYLSQTARKFVSRIYQKRSAEVLEPDKVLVSWYDSEYQLFKFIENNIYKDKLAESATDIDKFLELSLSLQNRRKSRAGKSFENHLASLFEANNLSFDAQLKSEGNKKPDFIFPGNDRYHDLSFPSTKLTFLGAKTTCKDRWRQILNEADRIPKKHLVTLQQGISTQQIIEMESEGVTLVVPKEYHSAYPAEKRQDIWTLQKFIDYVKSKEI
ncbi:MAG: type II restriction endonuclease [Streptococcaceae bacterium]|jgi:type II restriction enzyme|nr:type II restriction endonuclease [Streptococcaceae bacterium]